MDTACTILIITLLLSLVLVGTLIAVLCACSGQAAKDRSHQTVQEIHRTGSEARQAIDRAAQDHLRQMHDHLRR